MSKDDDERLFNFLTCKFYGTDDEMAEAAPFIGIITLVVIITFCIMKCAGA